MRPKSWFLFLNGYPPPISLFAVLESNQLQPFSKSGLGCTGNLMF